MALPVLNFPEINLRFQHNAKNKLQLFDVIRKKFVDVTPEEWVRQHIIHYLITEKKVPASVISVEKQIILNGVKKRYDIVVFNNSLIPILIIECKAFNIQIDQLTINQALRYNLELKVPFVFLSNGLNHIFIKMNENSPKISKEIPNYSEMLNL